MTNRLLVLFILQHCCSLVASEAPAEPKAEIAGVGQIKAQADYIKLIFNVRSECYATPSEAQDATDAIVAKIDKYLQTLKTPEDKFFKILTNGGFTNAFSRWLQNKEVCRNTFQKNTEITLNIGKSKDFSALFARLQEETLNFYHKSSDKQSIDKAQSFVTLGTPEPRLARTHRLELERKARSDALLDATANFKETIQTCAKRSFRIINIREAQSYNFPQPSNRFYQSAPSSQNIQAADIAPVRFDDLIISKELTVTFQVDGTLCLENAN